MHGSTYEERLKNAGLTSLRERRERGDAIEAFKTLNGFNKVKKELWFNVAKENARATRSTSKVSENGEEERRTNVLLVEGTRLEVRRNFFTVRVVKQWNSIPETVRNQTSVNGFKNAYDRWRANTTNNN